MTDGMSIISSDHGTQCVAKKKVRLCQDKRREIGFPIDWSDKGFRRVALGHPLLNCLNILQVQNREAKGCGPVRLGMLTMEGAFDKMNEFNNLGEYSVSSG
jgi:hypothetical protein